MLVNDGEVLVNDGEISVLNSPSLTRVSPSFY